MNNEQIAQKHRATMLRNVCPVSVQASGSSSIRRQRSFSSALRYSYAPPSEHHSDVAIPTSCASRYPRRCHHVVGPVESIRHVVVAFSHAWAVADGIRGDCTVWLEEIDLYSSMPC
jgi:hypothetical protein